MEETKSDIYSVYIYGIESWKQEGSEVNASHSEYTHS